MFPYRTHPIDHPTTNLYTMLHLCGNSIHFHVLYLVPINLSINDTAIYICISICVYQTTMTISPVVGPLPLIHGAVLPDLLAVPESLLIPPATNIYCLIFIYLEITINPYIWSQCGIQTIIDSLW